MVLEPTFYRNKSVLILGKQQSAFETANHIYGETASVMMVSRGRPRLAWETHYVGDLRAINSQYLDAYQLKSMDTVIDSDLARFGPFYKRADGKIALANVRGDQELFRTDDKAAFDFWDVVIRCTGWVMDLGLFADDVRPETTHSEKYPRMSGGFESANVDGLWFAGTLMHGNDWRRSSGGTTHPHLILTSSSPYRHLILTSFSPHLHSPSVGFIHGFRYLVRSLGKILELENHHMAWPSRSVSVEPSRVKGEPTSDTQMWRYVELATAILKRSSESSGPYQMFAVLMDVYAFDIDGSCIRYDEVPSGYMTEFLNRTGLLHETDHEKRKYIAVTMKYGEEYSGPGKDTFASSRVVRPFPLQ